ncbi:MAG: sugar-binding domain-containing protein, partial [Verrucomicrobiota bacterium]
MPLNGLWNYQIETIEFEAIQGLVGELSMTEGAVPEQWDGKLLVPFAVDSPLSGVMHVLRPQERIWYQRTFELRDEMRGKRMLLHVEASDWETSVYVNGKKVGQHRGAYDPFTFDISEALKDGENQSAICAWDATEQQAQPLGKQIMPENRKGFRYQPTGGIWQSVWLEAVPHEYLSSATLRSDLTGLTVIPKVIGSGVVRVRVLDGDAVVGEASGTGEIRVPVAEPELWSPQNPKLYDVELLLEKDGKAVDQVTSYAGFRTISRSDEGEILLNGTPVVMYGPLDQGYWPDGILTPPCDEAIVFDLEYLKDIGCNMARVHIKVHPARWYYHADRLGLLVIQDMICMPKYGQTVTPEAAANWIREFQEMIDDFGNHPSIISWCVFNEAWGQHETIKQTAWAKDADPSRLILSASGWSDHGVGDILDVHNYNTYPTLPIEDKAGRCITFGETGGHNITIDGHNWHGQTGGRKRSAPLTVSGSRMHFSDLENMDLKYNFYFRNLRHFVTRAHCRSFVYTQITDVEHECNGYMTYDREVSKLSKERFAEIHKQLYTPATYTTLTGTDWERSDAPAPEGKNPEPDWDAVTGNWKPMKLPVDSDKIIAANKKQGMLALRQKFTIKESLKRAVLEIRFKNGAYKTKPRPERLNGFQARSTVVTRVGVSLNGKVVRDHSMQVHAGHGECVSYLELTDEEVASLKA